MGEKKILQQRSGSDGDSGGDGGGIGGSGGGSVGIGSAAQSTKMKRSAAVHGRLSAAREFEVLAAFSSLVPRSSAAANSLKFTHTSTIVRRSTHTHTITVTAKH